MSGLTPDKKALLKQLMGSYSGKIDFNKIRDEWKKNETQMEEETKASLPPMARMKHMAQEAIQKKGFTEKDIDRILKIEKMEKKSGLTPKKKAELKQMMGKYSGKASLSLINMIFDRGYRQEVYDYYDQRYEETEDEKEIFESWQNRRLK